MFFALAFSVIGLLHLFIWLRLVADTALPQPEMAIASGIIGALFLSIVAIFVRREPLPRALRLPIYVWMGLAFIMAVTLGLTDLGVALQRAIQGSAPMPAVPLARVEALAALALAAALSGWGALSALSIDRVRLRRIEIPIDTIGGHTADGSADGLRIAQISDLHIGPTLREGWARRLVNKVNAQKPDLIVITGDIVDGAVEHIARFVEPLGALEARHGVYFCTGNHDFYSGADAWCQTLEALGLRSLRNRGVAIDGRVFLAGIDDGAGRQVGGGPDIASALAGNDRSLPVILLAHQPTHIDDAARRGVALQISGHTHGGQIWPMHHLVKLQSRHCAGLYQVGKSALYVSRGVGFWGPPLRLLAPAEIALLTLRSPASDG